MILIKMRSVFSSVAGKGIDDSFASPQRTKIKVTALLKREIKLSFEQEKICTR
jgi:hypothetical protein